MLDLDAYLRRIAYVGERTPTLATLRALQLHHLLAIAFENLDALAGRDIRLDIESLQRKILAGGRGGYCFEQNLLFAHALRALGFKVVALAGRVVWDRPSEEIRARTHMLLLVHGAEGRFLCDVGFGGLTPTGPLRLIADQEQATPHETFRIVDDAPDFIVQVHLRGEWKPVYRFDMQAQQQIDIEVLNFYVAKHPDSPMRGRLIAARAAADRRFALSNGTLTVYHRDGRREQRQLVNVREVRGVLGETFGIAVPSDDTLDATLARLLG